MANPYDEAVKKMASTIAASRFTKTPILINPDLGNQQTQGSFWAAPTNRIDVDLGKNPSYADFANTLHHEDIHALLNQSGNMTPNYNAGSFLDQIRNLFLLNAIRNVHSGFQQSGRMGEVNREMPAYAGAFKQGELPGVSQSNADDFITMLNRVVPQQTAATLNRIISSAKASR